MAVRGRSAKLYLERSKIIPTIRGPMPVMDPSLIPLLSLPLDEPLPLAEIIADGDPSPDRGLTEDWPHGST